MSVLRPVRLLTAAVVVVACGLCAAADAPKKDAAFGTGKATGGYLTKEQLRGCLTQQARTKQVDDEMRKQQAELVAQKAEIARNGEVLKGKLEATDRTDPAAVEAYNIEAAARDKQIDDYQASVTAFNARVEGAQADREAFAKNCDNRRYFEEDEIAIRKGK